MENIYKNKNYPHFDSKIKFKENTLPYEYKNKVENKNWIVKHGFYPFVQYKQKKYKYSQHNKIATDKSRTIMYCSHIDRCIYQFYANKLNEFYNKRVSNLKIDDVSIAYRSNLKKSNINFAENVFGFISENKDCVVYLTDFHKYFDNIDHDLLKQNVENILSLDRLPNDYFKVFKSVTKYCYAKYDDIVSFNKLTNPDIKINKNYFDRKGKFFTNEEFKRFKKDLDSTNEKYLKPNKNSYGIPQGSPISAVLSNIYLIDFDKEISDFVSLKKGLYRRYCDDIIIVMPTGCDNPNNIVNDIISSISFQLRKIPNLKLSEDKTKIYLYQNNSFSEIKNNDCSLASKSSIDYLGFSFDGKAVKIREKSINNYYRRLYKRIAFLNRYSKKYDRKVYRRKFYKQYSHLGSNEKKTKGKRRYGNFITYANLAHYTFKDKSDIKGQIKNHWSIINKNLD